MKMHKFFLKIAFIIFTVGITFTSFSQNARVKPDMRLYQCYTKSYIDNLVETNPDQIAYLNYFLDNSYYVVSLKSEKPIEGIDVNTLINKLNKSKFSEIKYVKSNFNILKYNFTFGDLSAFTYVWKEAGIAIVLRPENHIKDDFKMLKINNK